MKNIVIAIVVAAATITFWFAGSYPKAFYYIDFVFNNVNKYINDNLLASVLHRPVTVAELQDKYNTASARKIRVLLVPGHEPDYGGAEYKNLKERDMNVELAQDLESFLKNDNHYEVVVARDTDKWNPVLADYFNTHWQDILSFVQDSKDDTLHLINSGTITKPESTVDHNSVRMDVADRLYGINKWSKENSIDIAIHVHFNDYPRSYASGPGKYSGFSIYVPEHQYFNSTTTKLVADSIFSRLSKYNPVSNLPIESGGIVEDSDLIAVGVNNTTDSASMLIEYGYIYEPQFQKEEVSHSVIKDLAFQTYLGLQDFFGKNNIENQKGVNSFAYDTLMLPHSWSENLTPSKGNANDILSLQSALLIDGEYPLSGRTKNDCPRTGKLGPCTLESINAFQEKYGIKGEDGIVGEQTRGTLNGKYSF